jgi:hypothetical protein
MNVINQINSFVAKGPIEYGRLPGGKIMYVINQILFIGGSSDELSMVDHVALKL